MTPTNQGGARSPSAPFEANPPPTTPPPGAAAPPSDYSLVTSRYSLLDGGSAAAPKILAILNLTPDSFSDGGKYSTTETAIARAHQLVADGADILDIGGHSTRPGHAEIPPAVELARILPPLRQLLPTLQVPISIDTYQPEVAEAALAAGAHIINDVHALQRDPRMASVVGNSTATLILMHNDPAFTTLPGDPIENIKRHLLRSIDIALRAGISTARLIIDPGIGFHKTHTQNLQILARLHELHSLKLPVLLGASRKKSLGIITNTADPSDRLEATLATTALATWQGIQYIRVHDPLPNKRTAQTIAAIRASLPH